MLLRKLGKKKPQYEEVPTKEIRIEVLYNDENQCLSFSGASMAAGNYHQDF